MILPGLYELETKENPPTLLNNPKKLKISNHSLDFIHYHLATNLIQPVIFAFIFPIFYGLMLGDVGYGLVILLVSRWVIRRSRG